MSFMKMASMASVAMISVLVIAMIDMTLPESFFESVLKIALLVVTVFLGYRLAIAIQDLRARAKTHQINRNEYRRVIALGLIVLIIGGLDVYMIVNPQWDTRIAFAGGWLVFLIFLIARLALHINISPKVEIRKE